MQAKPSYTAVVEPSRWGLQSGGGYLALFGIPFLRAGLFVLLIPLDNPPGEGRSSWEEVGRQGCRTDGHCHALPKCC
jgi:hypothetical protein